MTHRAQPDLVGRSRKLRALLAGGALLGIGATATLAAWTDDVWVSAAFNTEQFNVQAAVTPAPGNNWQNPSWQEFDSPESPGTLAFPLTPPGAPAGQPGLAPGNLIFAPLYLRVESGDGAAISSPDAPDISNVTGNGALLSQQLDLTVFRGVTPANCNSSGVVGATTAFSGKLNQALGSDLVTLDTDGSPTGLCFRVTMPNNIDPVVAGSSIGQIIWHLEAAPV